MNSNITHSLSRVFQLACAVLLVFVAMPLPAQASSRADDGKDERIAKRDKAMEQGLLAAEAKSWKLAARYFEEARQADPGSPAVLRNLALTADRRGGAELPAIARYQAFLAAKPPAATAALVQKRIKELEIGVEAKLEALLEVAVKTTELMNDPKQRSRSFRDIVEMQAQLGDFKSALLTAARCEESPPFGHRSMALRSISFAQQSNGDLASALKTAEKIPSPGFKAMRLEAIGMLYAKAGDRTRARRCLSKAAELEGKDATHLGVKQVAIGDIYGAGKTLESLSSHGDKSLLLVHLAKHYHDLGDKQKATETIAMSYEHAAQSEYDWQVDLNRGKIAQYYLAIGDKSASQEIANKIPADGEWSSTQASTLHELVQSHVKKGNMDGATKLAERMTNKIAKSHAMLVIADAQAKAGDAEAAQGSLKMVDHEIHDHEVSDVANVYRSIATTYFKAGKREQAKDAISKALSLAETNRERLPIIELQLESDDLKGGADSAFKHFRTWIVYPTLEEYHRHLAVQFRIGDRLGVVQTVAKLTRTPREVIIDMFNRAGADDPAYFNQTTTWKIAGICLWTQQAAKFEDYQFMVDFDGSLRDLQGKSPVEAMKALMEINKKMQSALQFTREASLEFRQLPLQN